MNHRIAVFDVDGTLARGYYIVKFARFLSESGMFSKVELGFMESILYRYNKGVISYKQASSEAVLCFGRGIKNAKQADVAKAGEFYIKTHGNEKYSFTDGLIGMLKSRNYGIMLVSASPSEIIEPFSKSIGSDVVFATILRTDKGVFNGAIKQDCSKENVKKRLVENYFHINGVGARYSAGFGDTEADLAFLSIVGFQVAINPNENLETEAKKKGWLIFREGDDMKSVLGSYIP